jgi:hypothetical protein
MARRVYFAFHYQNDISRVNVVRNSWVTQEREAAGFYDASLWEKAKRTGDDAVKRMISDGIKGTSVTVFLLGSQTAERKWVRYELERSCENGNGLLGLYIHQVKNFAGQTSIQGANILDHFQVTDQWGNTRLLSQIYSTYDYIGSNGYRNLGDWIEAAAKVAGR